MSTKDQTYEANDTTLTEDDVRRIAQEEASVKTEDGETVRLADLVAAGLTKEQAFGAMGLVALWGISISAAVGYATRGVGAQTSTGSGELRVGEIISNEIEVGDVDAEELTGGIVGRASAITHLAGNIYVDDDDPASPVNDDIWADLSEVE